MSKKDERKLIVSAKSPNIPKHRSPHEVHKENSHFCTYLIKSFMIRILDVPQIA